jgi:23S rRNA pseudouridine1911/1915/1917 synthase
MLNRQMKKLYSASRKSRVSDRLVTFEYQKTKSQRLDKFLVNCLPEYSRSRLQNLIKDEHVLINGKPARKAGQPVESGMIVTVNIPPIASSKLQPEDISLDIIFENDDLMVVNKPAGMVVHPAAGHDSGTLVHAALAHAPKMEGIGGVQRPGIVHRLDKNTSGVIILAKNDRAHQFLQDQFRERTVNKTYLALVDGSPPTSTGRVEAAIGRDTTQRKRMTVTPDHKGRQAISNYRTLERFPHHSLLEVHPLTGRTHQIRVHMAFLKCPIVGDTIYGRRKTTIPINRHFLHAQRLGIVIPGENETRSFIANLPGELEDILKSLRN